MHIRYFITKDILLKEHMESIHYPTYMMRAYFYNKPLQYSLFRKMRDIVMGLTPFPEEGCDVNSEQIGELKI